MMTKHTSRTIDNIAKNTTRKIKEPKVSFTELRRNSIYINDCDELLRFLGFGESIETGQRSAIFQVSKKSLLAVIESSFYYHCDTTSGLKNAPSDIQSINQ